MAVGLQNKRLQALYVGEAGTKIDGLADAGITVAPAGDVGAGVSGVAGDTALEITGMNLYTITVVVHQTSTGIDTLYDLLDTVGSFPIKYELGRATVEGVCVMGNEGELSGAKGVMERTITLICARTTGGRTGSGSILQA